METLVFRIYTTEKKHSSTREIRIEVGELTDYIIENYLKEKEMLDDFTFEGVEKL